MKFRGSFTGKMANQALSFVREFFLNEQFYYNPGIDNTAKGNLIHLTRSPRNRVSVEGAFLGALKRLC